MAIPYGLVARAEKDPVVEERADFNVLVKLDAGALQTLTQIVAIVAGHLLGKVLDGRLVVLALRRRGVGLRGQDKPAAVRLEHAPDLRACLDLDVALAERAAGPQLDTINNAGLRGKPRAVDASLHGERVITEMVAGVPAHAVPEDDVRAEVAVEGAMGSKPVCSLAHV